MKVQIISKNIDIPFLAEKLIQKRCQKLQQILRNFCPSSALFESSIQYREGDGKYVMQCKLKINGTTLYSGPKMRPL